MNNSEVWAVGGIFEALGATGQPKRYRLDKFLGGGATSVAYLTTEITPDDSLGRSDIVLKILKPETAAQWMTALEDEIAVLRALWDEEEKDNEEKDNETVHAVPKVHDASPEGVVPAYLAMEYVPYPSVDALALPPKKLPERLHRMLAVTQDVEQELGRALSDAASTLLGGQDVARVLGDAVNHAKSFEISLDQAVTALDDWLAVHGGLPEEDVIRVGVQMCRLLDRLHRTGRAYKDFQLHNVRYDREHRQIKVLDWNVVTGPSTVDLKRSRGMEYVQNDLARLASYLFFLCTLVRGPEGGASPRVLTQLGGAGWSEHTSLALRLVLERALSPDLASRYARAYGPAPEGLPSPCKASSLGAALAVVGEWRSRSPGGLVALANQLSEQGLGAEALAASELARERLSEVPLDLQKKFGNALDEADKKAVAASARPALELALRLLETLNARDAADALEQGQRDFPADLQVRRWQVIVQALARLSLPSLHQIWDSGQLQRAMRRAEQGHFEEAKILLDAIVTEPALDLTLLSQDMELATLLKRAEIGWLKLQAARDLPGRGREARQAAGELLAILDESDRYLKSHADHPYLEYVAAAWSQHTLCRSAARSIVNEPDVLPTYDLNDDLVAAQELLLRQNAPGAAVKKLEILLRDAATPEQTAEILRQLAVARAAKFLLTFLDEVGRIEKNPAAEAWFDRTVSDEVARPTAEGGIAILEQASEAVRNWAASKVGERYQKAVALRSPVVAKRFAVMEKLLLGQSAPDRSDELAGLEKSVTDEIRDAIQRVTARLAELEGSKDPDEIKRGLKIIDVIEGPEEEASI